MDENGDIKHKHERVNLNEAELKGLSKRLAPPTCFVLCFL